MSRGWQFVLNETSVHFLLALNARNRQFLIRGIELLLNEPLQKGDFEERDNTDRLIQMKVMGSFVISFWPDQLVRELRIVRIERV